MPARSADGTAALEKALDVLDAVGSAPAGLSQAELATQLALPRTTLYRLLGTLTQRALLRRDPLRRVYCLGQRCMDYARAAYTLPDLVAAAGTELRALRDLSGETTYLATQDGLEVVALERCASPHNQRSQSEPGQRKPMHSTSQGKAILAALPAPERDALVKELVLTPVTPRSLTDRRRLVAELKLTAQRGWALDDEEMVLGTRCCGAAIVDRQGRVRGAISVAGPAFRLTLARLQLLGPEVVEAARRIGAQLSAAQAVQPAVGTLQPVPGDWAFHGAWPHWHAGEGALYWADALAPALHRLVPGQDDALISRLDAPVQSLLLHQGQPLLQSAEQWQRLQGGQLQAVSGMPARPCTALAAHPQGGLWACQPEGERWRVGELGPQGDGLGGWLLPEPATALAWQPDGQALVLACAHSGSLQVAEPGRAAPRRLATVPRGSGQLGGVAVDARGGVWAALLGGWSVARFEPDGAMDQVLPLPVPSPTDLCFGGADGRTLYITSSRDTLSREALEAAPLSGRLFAMPGVGA